VTRIEFGAAGVQSIEFRATECDTQGMPNLIEDEATARPILERFRRLSATMGSELAIEGSRAIAYFGEANVVAAAS
jgi:poly-gamma-glutamate synthesis protein (capsule biosynthesis protein)